MMSLLKRNLFFFFFLTLISSACHSDKGKNIPDVSQIDVDIDIHRFEKDLFAIDTNHIAAGFEELKAKYPVFLPEIFLARILPMLQDTTFAAHFISDPHFRQIYDTSMVVFSDASDIEADLEQAFRYYKYYLPERKIPKIVSFISEYSLGTFTYESELLGIGWDLYLGADYPRYNPNFFPKYIKRTMNKDHLVARTMEALSTDLVGEPNGERMVDIMINNGKKLYLLDLLLPLTPDSVKLGYTANQVNWCEINELEMWSHFLREDLLYSSERKNIRKLVDFSPSSPGMPDESPGRTANWVGWQIVKSYMKRNPKATVEELIALKDAQALLDKARYKPKR